MNLETARKIIEQEALLLLIAKPYLQFNINNGVFLARIFVDEGFKLPFGQKNANIHRHRNTNFSDIVTDCWVSRTNPRRSLYFIRFKIAHPIHGTCYYTTYCYYSEIYRISEWDKARVTPELAN